MSQLKEWMYGGKISKLVVVISSKETGEHVERWQFDVSSASAVQPQRLNECIGSNIWKECQIQIFEEDSRQ
jgi:hypothetical protein